MLRLYVDPAVRAEGMGQRRGPGREMRTQRRRGNGGTRTGTGARTHCHPSCPPDTSLSDSVLLQRLIAEHGKQKSISDFKHTLSHATYCHRVDCMWLIEEETSGWLGDRGEAPGLMGSGRSPPLSPAQWAQHRH